MADAAKLLQIPIQYCMSNPRHAMMALELNVVTQVSKPKCIATDQTYLKDDC